MTFVQDSCKHSTASETYVLRFMTWVLKPGQKDGPTSPEQCCMHAAHLGLNIRMRALPGMLMSQTIEQADVAMAVMS